VPEVVPFVHPYIPNSAPEVRAAMLRAIGVGDVEELYRDIPAALRFRGRLRLPEALLSEADLRRHGEALLRRNVPTTKLLSFLGAGCYQHFVPAVCDEIAQRAEFLTEYAGETYSAKGKFQALFEYQSMLGELIGMDVVTLPTYDGATASGTCLRLAARLTGRSEVLLAGTISPERLAVLRDYCKPALRLGAVGFDHASGLLDLDDLRRKLSDDTAAVYFENPSYLGFIETQGAEIAALAHAAGAQCVVYADPSSLGVLAAPADYGADLVCGDAQPLGIHMSYGGGLHGFIGTRDEERYVAELPNILVSIAPTAVEGEFGFGPAQWERSPYVARGEAHDFTGTTAGLWGIVAGAYLALMGPEGMRELGETILERAHYAMALLDEIPGVQAPALSATGFKEFVVRFDGTGREVAEINAALLERGILGGKDLSRDFPMLGRSALYCVTEVHTADDIERLAGALREVVG